MSFQQKDHQGLLYHEADRLSEIGGLLHGFATRLGGVSEEPFAELNLGRVRGDRPEHVRENYRRFTTALGGEGYRLALCRQIHSDRILTIRREDALQDLYDETVPEADALITNEPGLFLTVFYADCIPVLLYDPVHKAIGAIHSGWRGTAACIAPKAVAQMGRVYGSRPGDILVAIGPGICPCCFETHADVPEAMQVQFGDAALPYMAHLPAGKFQVDLKGMIAQSLLACGVRPEHRFVLPLCTCCHPELYWSHRRLGEQRGNQAAMIALAAPV